MKHFFTKSKFIIILLLVTFVFRIPSLFEPYWYGDEGVYQAVGLAVRNGAMLYKDAFDNKPPLIYLLTAITNGTMFGFRLLLMIASLGATYFFYRLCQKLIANENSARMATVVFAILTTVRLLEGNIANAENFILLSTTLGFYLILSILENKKNKKEYRKYFLAGLILSFGFLLKVPAVFDFLALYLFLLFFQDKKKFISLGKNEIALGVGYAVPILITSLYFLIRGSFSEYFNACYLQMFGYLSSWETGSHAFSPFALLKSDLVIKGIFVATVSGLLFKKRKNLSQLMAFIPLWFVFALFGATLSGRPYPHYLLQIVPPLAIILSFFLLKKKALSLSALGLILVLSLAIVRYRFWAYPTLSYYQNFLQFALGQKEKLAYFKYFHPNLPQMYELAEFIQASTKETDKIFIWSDDPSLYPLSRRLPATPYTTAYHVVDLKQTAQVGKSLTKQLVPLIIVDKNGRKFPELEALVKTKYRRIEEFGNFLVYLRRDSW
ncbi:MAG: ArnT family glycosyltransferase [Patescibacteria group bacterium]|jgi:hypothetical protein